MISTVLNYMFHPWLFDFLNSSQDLYQVGTFQWGSSLSSFPNFINPWRMWGFLHLLYLFLSVSPHFHYEMIHTGNPSWRTMGQAETSIFTWMVFKTIIFLHFLEGCSLHKMWRFIIVIFVGICPWRQILSLLSSFLLLISKFFLLLFSLSLLQLR